MTPGSAEAINHGCKCPVIDNCYGQGRTHGVGKPQFVKSWSCPIHGCTCLADWRTGQQVRNPGCNIHGTPYPEVKCSP